MDEQQVTQPAPKRPVGPIIGIVVAILLISSIALVASMKKSPETGIQAPLPPVQKTQEQQEAAALAQQEQTLDTAREAIVANDADKCAGLPTDQERMVCNAYLVMANAQAAGDVALCAEISDDYWTSACADQVIFYRAVAEQKPSLCDGMAVEARIPPCKAQAAPKE
ncbi:MAG: hypothetical protein Q7S84_04605 [bacterium]|nr:hypothetical protein [bacterium]